MTVRIRTAAWWRYGVAALCIAALAATGGWAWLLAQRDEQRLLVLALPALLASACAALMRWVGPSVLRWDGQQWQLAETARGAASSRTGSLTLVFDGGDWMLLRLHGADRAPLRSTWLALSRADMPGEWHALRCAVYSPRPDTAGPSAQAPADPPA